MNEMATTSFIENTVIKKDSGKLFASVFSSKKNVTKIKKYDSNVITSKTYFRKLRELDNK
ncbi:MAG TPA: hypothetical protein PLX66_01765 [Bacilli bacterium]|nr:hypothetical protein [Bacilli bacterium]